MNLARTALLGAAIAAMAAGCDRDAIYSQRSFSDAVYDAYSECSESEIRFLTGKHNIQTVFEKCGSNHFTDFSWAPDGIHLFFNLPLAAHIINGEQKTIKGIPTEKPTGAATWLDKDRMVIPLGPAEGAEKNRLVLYDRARGQSKTMEVDLRELDDLQFAGPGRGIYLTAAGESARQIWRVDVAEGVTERAFAWHTSAVDTFTYNHTQDAVVIGQGDAVLVARGETGEVLSRHDDATRGSLHAEGRYLALETLGDPILPFDQRTWDELSEEARKREQRRTKEWLQRQPDWVPKEVHPPTVDVVDLQKGERYRFTAFYGDHFEWYPASFYCSFILWGMEGKELNKNVALTNLAERLRMLDKGEVPLGTRRFTSTKPAEE